MSEVSSKMSDLHWLLQNSRIVIIVREIYAVDNLEPAPDAENSPPTDAKRRFNFWVTVKNLLPRRRIILIAGGVVIFIGVAVYLYTGCNPLTKIVEWSKTAVNGILQLLVGGRTTRNEVEGPSNETPVLERLAPDSGNTSNGGNACGIRIQGNGSVRMEGRNSFGVSGSKNSTGIAVDDSGRVEMTATSDTSLDVNGQGNVYGMRTRDIGAARMEGRSDIVVSGSQNATGIAVENSSRVKMTPTSDTRIRVNGQDRRPVNKIVCIPPTLR